MYQFQSEFKECENLVVTHHRRGSNTETTVFVSGAMYSTYCSPEFNVTLTVKVILGIFQLSHWMTPGLQLGGVFGLVGQPSHM